eukprot:445431-Prymnesium_polylepis.1
MQGSGMGEGGARAVATGSGIAHAPRVIGPIWHMQDSTAMHPCSTHSKHEERATKPAAKCTKGGSDGAAPASDRLSEGLAR